MDQRDFLWALARLYLAAEAAGWVRMLRLHPANS